MIQLNFGSYKEYNMKNRFFNMDLAGGALLDIGVYALSIARSFMESKPDQVLSQVKFAPTGADEQAGDSVNEQRSTDGNTCFIATFETAETCSNQL